MIKKLLLSLLLLLCPSLSWGYAAYDNSASGNAASVTSLTPLTFSHTNNGNILYVWNINAGTTEATGVTYGGVALNNFGDFQTANGYSIDAWYLAGAMPKGANNVIVSYGSTVSDAVAISVSYTGVGSGWENPGFAPAYNGESGEDISDGTFTGLSSTASTGTISINYSNDLGAYAVFSLITGTEPSSTGTRRLDTTGATIRGDLFDLYKVTTTGLSSTVGNGAWWLECVVLTSNKGLIKFLK